MKSKKISTINFILMILISTIMLIISLLTVVFSNYNNNKNKLLIYTNIVANTTYSHINELENKLKIIDIDLNISIHNKYVKNNVSYKENNRFILFFSDENNIYKLSKTYEYSKTYYILIFLFILIYIIFNLSIMYWYIFLNNTFKKIDNISKKLSNLVDTDPSKSNIDIIFKKIISKMQITQNEKERFTMLIDNITIGVLFISKKNRVILINSQAEKLFHITKDDVSNKDYVFLIRYEQLDNSIDKVFKTHNQEIIDIEILDRSYTFYINYVNFDNVNEYVSLTFIDNTEINKLEIAKKQFFANASHELKSPLTSIIGYQQLINEDILTDKDEIKNIGKTIISEANRMNNIIKDMLELSKLEGNYQTRIDLCEIDLLINELVKEYDTKLKEKNILVNLNLEKTKILIDKNRAYQLVRNIFENAIKYNKVNGIINILLKNKILKISDTGIGISKNDMVRIFERFYRVDKNLSRNVEGTGLGLAIVKHISQFYNFKYSVYSNIDEGSTFEIDMNTNSN